MDPRNKQRLRLLAKGIISTLPRRPLHWLVSLLVDWNPAFVWNSAWPHLRRKMTLDNMSFDLTLTRPLNFEHIAGLFCSNSLNHGVITMPIRQAAYLFGLVRLMNAQKVIEIGRYKGGSTFLIAAAMNGNGDFWSIDIGESEARLHGQASDRPYDLQVKEICTRLGLNVTLIVGDSRTVQIDTGEVDVVLIDGDHRYEFEKYDFERFGRRVRVGGAVLFDDAFDEEDVRSHSNSVGKLVREITSGGEYRFIKAINRMAHLERVK